MHDLQSPRTGHSICPEPFTFLAKVVILAGGKDQLPEIFARAFSERGAVGVVEEGSRQGHKRPLNWGCNRRRCEHGAVGDGGRLLLLL